MSARPAWPTGSSIAPARRNPEMTPEGLEKFWRARTTRPFLSARRRIVSGPGKERTSNDGNPGLTLATLCPVLRPVDPDDAVRGDQVLLRDAENVDGRDRRQPIQVRFEPRIVGEHLAVAHPERLVGDALAPVSEQRPRLLDGFLHFVYSQGLVHDSIEFPVQPGQGFFGRSVRPDGDFDRVLVRGEGRCE